jgi:CRP/FNR family transcriptional regulator
MDNKCDHCDSKGCVLYQYVGEKWHDLLGSSKTCIDYDRNESVVQEGMSVDGIYIVQTGGLKVFKKSRYRSQTLRFLKSGEFVAQGVFSQENDFKLSAKTLLPSKICFVEASVFKQMFKNNPAFAAELLRIYSEQLNRTDRRLRNNSIMSVRERISDVLIVLAENYGEVSDNGIKITIELARNDLSELAGTYPEQISRILKEFEQEKLIRRSHRIIEIIDLNKLRKILAFYK